MKNTYRHGFDHTEQEIKVHHRGLTTQYIKKLLSCYTLSEIIAGRIDSGIFYPEFEIGKQKKDIKPFYFAGP